MAEAASAAGRPAIPPGVPVVAIAALENTPHEVFSTYRPSHPLIANEEGFYLVLRYADVEALSNDPRAVTAETAFPESRGIVEGVLFDAFKYGMLTANGDVHRRRRAPFSRTFAAKMIAEMRPRIRAAARSTIQDWLADGQVELVGQFASPLPARLISDLLGLPHEDIPVFTALVYETTRFLSFGFTPDEFPRMEAASLELRTYVERVLEERRRAPREDFLSTFLASAEAAGEMSPLEIIFQIYQIIVAATDTTRVALVMQVALLLQHPEQWRAVCEDPGLIAAAVAESMRFEPSVAAVSRLAAQDIDLSGAVIPAGQFFTLSTMSAMRDPQVYERPDVFDIHRTGQPRLHPIFGGGPHRCIGEALAKAELEESLAALTEAIPNPRLDRAPVITGHFGIRRVDEMRLSWPV
ncbi:MAG: cytochrome P450 [Caulobacteraceae bacterium]